MQQKKTKKTLILALIVAVVVVLGIFLLNNRTGDTNKDEKNKDENNNVKNNSVSKNTQNNKDENYGTLIGVFVYEKDGTHYEFKKDGTGSMSGTGFDYKYNYTTEGDVLKIDFEAKEVHDAEYTYKVDGNILNLKAKSGTETLGEEYKLEKENK